ncbi:MAG TPA: sodium ion-translocating decarboxylase subunit beta [Paludibacter sp.]|nr:sodium ion-translocating decarboxylase subunit beta [Paludibacter sp.]
METKKHIFLLIAFLFASIHVNVQAQTVKQTDSTAVVATQNQASLQNAQAVQESSSSWDYIEKSFIGFLKSTGFANMDINTLIMIIIACILLYLAIVKQFEPLLLLPIAFGMLLTNLPGAGLYHSELFQGGHVHWDKFTELGGLLDYLYLGVKLGIYPCIIFLGVGAMTDFGPMLANPKSLLLGAAAQLGIFVTYLAAIGLAFTSKEAASIGIIGGADGPTAIFLTTRLAPELLGPIAVAAYSYMALVPVIQPPIMKLLTTKKERAIRMKQLRIVSKKEKIIFPIFGSAFISLLLPPAAPLIGSLLLGNLMRETGVVERLSKTVQNELMNITTIFLGITVGATATASAFLNIKTMEIMIIGVLAFSFGTAGGVLLAKFMNLFTKEKVNPLIGSAGVSAVPMAARVSQVVGQETDPGNFLLMHAMGPNVAGVIGSAVAAGLLLTMLS